VVIGQDFAMDIVTRLKQAIDAAIEWDKLPVRYVKTRSGWAAYKGTSRVTRWHFSEEAAREDVTEQEARNIPLN
jgi:hypothetical protein